MIPPPRRALPDWTTVALITDDLAFLPARLRDVPYAYARDPVSTAPGDLTRGANCQLYAYAVLAHFGRRVPPLRSAELWSDETALRTVAAPAALDLLLFDPGPDPDPDPDPGAAPGRPDGYGAHVAVHLAPGRILHLCKEVGRPALWTLSDFAARPRYARLLGAKRSARPRPAGGSRCGES
jgi:hypothetical protein